MKVNFKRYALYLVRWQLSTPILAGVGIILASMGAITAAIVTNLIGGLIFFRVDLSSSHQRHWMHSGK